MPADKKSQETNIIENMINDILFNGSLLPEDIPDIGLYMDQVTTLMETHLSHAKRYDDDKIMTKMMINNYTKNRLLPPSDKKKYSRDHVLLIIMIYYLKHMMSISDIKTILEPLSGRFFHPEDKNMPGLPDIYRQIILSFEERKEEVETSLLRLAEESGREFDSYRLSESDRAYLDELALICNLSFDIYVRKQMIEKLIDRYKASHPASQKGKKRTPKKG